MSPGRHMHGMGDPDEVFTNIPTEAALKQAEITSLRALADNVTSLGNTMAACVTAIQEMRREMKETRETVIRMEPLAISLAETKANYLDLSHRVDALETERDRNGGARSLADTVVRYWPAAVGFAGVVWAYLKASGKA